MDPQIIDVSRTVWQQTNDWVLNIRGRSGAEGLTGAKQVVYGIQPRWETAISLITMSANLLIWRAIQAAMRGRINVLRVPVVDLMPIPTMGPVEHDDDTEFDDGTGYGGEVCFSVPELVEAGSETITIDASEISDALQPGMYFSYDDWLYVVTTIEVVDGLTTYAFEPPLRRSIPAGGWVTLEASALVKFETDLEGRTPLQTNRLLTSTINVQEWVSRP